MKPCTRRVVPAVAISIAAAVVGACNGTSGPGAGNDSAISNGPSPSEMCPVGEYPIAAAYDLETGAFRWVTCDVSPDMHVAVAASDSDVWLMIPYPQQAIRIDARSGDIEETMPGELRDVPADADRAREEPPATAQVRVGGGQDDPLVGFDQSTGRELWRAEGIPVYDDVWAYDDGAVYVRLSEIRDGVPGSWMVAYEIASGAEKWRTEADASGWPWHVAGDRLFAMWFDLVVLDVENGNVVWRTSFGEPAAGFPRMFGAVANDDIVVVSFTSVGAGGD